MVTPATLLTPGKQGSLSTITDEVNSFGRFNRVTHSRETWRCPLHFVEMQGAMSKPGGIVYTSGYAGAADACAHGLDTDMPFMATDSQMLAEASSELNPKVVTPMFDIAQQTGEFFELLRSLTGMFDSGEKVARELKRLNRVNSPVVRRLLGQRTFDQLSIRDWATLAVQSHLGYQFAYKPTLKAIADFQKSASGLRDELKKYFDSVQVLHGRSTRETSKSYSTTNYYHSWGNDRNYVKVVHATAKVRYQTPPTVENCLRIMESLLGALPHVDTLYELYPCSFIVDFVADFGSVLRQWAERPIDQIQYTVLETGWSVKTTRTSNGWMDLNKGMDRAGWRSLKAPQLVTGSLTRVSYLREPKVLDLSTFTPKPLHISLPNAGKLATMAEVAYAMKNGYRRFIRVLQ